MRSYQVTITTVSGKWPPIRVDRSGRLGDPLPISLESALNFARQEMECGAESAVVSAAPPCPDCYGGLEALCETCGGCGIDPGALGL